MGGVEDLGGSWWVLRGIRIMDTGFRTGFYRGIGFLCRIGISL